MKKKHTLILLFMLVFTGVALLGYMPARAADVLPCSPLELANRFCFEITVPDNDDPQVLIPIWVVRAVDKNGEAFDPDSPDSFIWPYEDELVRAVFGYKGGTTEAAIQAVKAKQISRPSAWSYIWFSLYSLPIESNPPGADLDISKIHSTCDVPSLGNRHAWKQNARVTFGKVARFDIVMPAGTGIDLECGKAGVIWSDNCEVLPIAVPAGTGVPVTEERQFFCSDTDTLVTVEYDPCTSEVERVLCGTEVVSPINITNDNYLYMELPGPGDPTKSIPIENMGPPGGVVACTDSGPVFLVGDQAWWCGDAPE